MIESSGTLTLAWDCTGGKDETVLVVGKRINKNTTKIIKEFTGAEAEALLTKLMEKGE